MLWMFLVSCTDAPPNTASPSTGAHIGTERLCETPPVDGFSCFTLEVAERGFNEVLPDLRDILQSGLVQASPLAIQTEIATRT